MPMDAKTAVLKFIKNKKFNRDNMVVIPAFIENFSYFVVNFQHKQKEPTSTKSTLSLSVLTLIV